MDTQFLTKPAGGLLNRVIASPHTSIAAGVWAASSVVSKLGAIWFPAHADQFKQTADAIKDVAVTYGLLMGGDSGSKPVDNPAPSDTPKA